MLLLAGVSVPVSTGSDWLDDDIELINDLGTGSLVTDESGYTQQLGDITSLLLLIIFFMGMAAGLVCASIMWKRVK